MKIWDLPTRIYHWLQVLLFTGLLLSGFSNNGPHAYLGLCLFTLLVWRLIWGFYGRQSIRFSQFLTSPATIVRYLAGKEPGRPGHNPLGGWMVVILLFTLLSQCLSGLVIADLLPVSDQLMDWSDKLHSLSARMLIFLVALHLLAILIYKLRAKPLLLAMITGKQAAGNNKELYFASNNRAALVLIAASFVTIAIVAQSLV